MEQERYVEQNLSSLQPGDHLCAIYEDERQHGETLVGFLVQGLMQGQKVITITDDLKGPLNALPDTEGTFESAMAHGQLLAFSTQEIFLRDGAINFQAAHLRLCAEIENAIAEGYPSVRIANAMHWICSNEIRSDRLIAYENRLNVLPQARHAVILCQYPRSVFEPHILIDLLTTHPQVYQGAGIYKNAYYIPPEIESARDRAAAHLDNLLENLTGPSTARNNPLSTRTERALIESEQALRKRDAQFRSLVESSPFGILLTDEDGTVIEYNTCAEEIYQRPAEGALGRPFWDIRAASWDEDQRSPAAYHELKESLLKFYRTGTAPWLYKFEDRDLTWPDGQIRRIQRVRFPIPTERGFMLASISRDITEERRAALELEQYHQRLESMVEQRTMELQHEIQERQQVEEVLRESEGRYRALVNQAPLSILVAQSGSYVFANPAIVQRLGYASAYELIGRSVLDTIAPESQEDFQERQKYLMRGAPSDPVITAFRCKDGSVYHSESTCVPILYQGRPAVLIIGQDVTERLRYEEQLKSSLAEKEVMLREIHHRVKNNLNVIIALVDLQKAAQSDPQVQAVFKELQSRVYSMALVHESLFRSPNLAEVDFTGYLKTLVSSLHSAYGPAANVAGAVPVSYHVEAEEKTLKIETAIPCGLIVNELVTNAMKYAFPAGFVSRDPSGCRITVRLKSMPGPTGSREENLPEENCLKLTVHDNGIGLPAGFNWQSTTTLGLQLVQVLVRQLGGQISLETGGGVTWCMIFREQR